MFVISLDYTVPFDIIDRHLPAHLEWLKKYYDAGLLLASGRKVGAHGGVILARHVDRDKLEKILAEDPFKTENLAEYEIIEFLPRMTSPELEGLLDEVGS